MIPAGAISLLTTALGIGVMSQFHMLWVIPCIILKIFGIASYTVKNDKERMKGMLKILKNETVSSSSIFEYGKLRPAGVFVGRWFCGYYIESSASSDGGTEIVLISSAVLFTRLIERSAPQSVSLCLDMRPKLLETTVSEHEVNIWNRKGSYTSFYYRPFKIDLSNIYPIGDQPAVVHDIMEQYRHRKRLTVFIHGNTGSGKSTVGLLVAKELGGSYCHDFNPTDPGDTFLSLLNDIEHTGGRGDGDGDDKGGPVVVVLEEINVIISAIHSGNIDKHKNVCTSVHNKTTFNSFLDDMVFHKNIILILTSNVSIDDINRIDSSYLRKGRINSYYSMMRPIEPV